MRKIINAIYLFAGFYFPLGWAATTATAVVTFSILPILSITISGNPGTLNAMVGSTTYDTSTTYGVTCNETNQTVTGMIDTAMPTGVTLSIELQAPPSATSDGLVAMTTTPQNLVENISNVDASGLMVTYALSADITATPISSQTRTVTYTIGP